MRGAAEVPPKISRRALTLGDVYSQVRLLVAVVLVCLHFVVGPDVAQIEETVEVGC